MRINENGRIWNALGLLLFGAMIAGILGEVLPWFLAPVAPDAMPFFSFGRRSEELEYLLTSGDEFTPHRLYWLIFHPLLANKLTYIGDTLALTLAGVFYLRGRSVRPAAAWLGGLALGFSGYTFTLLSAGHRGYFQMIACAAFSFGLLTRCFTSRRWIYFALLGVCMAWALPGQPDVLAFVALLAAAYALWLTFAKRADPVTPPVRRVARVWPRFLLSVAVGLLVGWPGIRYGLVQQVNLRKEQIQGTSGANTAVSSSASTEAEAAKKKDQWIFATNWSLPPEDVVEFVVPGVFGNDSFQPPYPYWGRLGQPYGSQPGAGVMPNYRQHTVYLGAFSVCFAMFAGMLWWRTRRARGVAEVSLARAAAGDPLVDVPFWVGAWVVCLLLAMGRYTPFYRLIYAIPYADLIRCPVKFHHLVEICTAFLFGLGVELWLCGAPMAAPEKKGIVAPPSPMAVVYRSLTILAAVAAGVLLLAAGIVSASSGSVAAHIAQMGLGSYGATLADYTVANLLRAACVFGLAALLFGLGRPRVGRERPASWLLALLALALVADVSTVDRRYIRVMNLQPFYERNVVVDAALARGGLGAGVADYMPLAREGSQDWFASALYRNGLRMALPAGDTNDAVCVQAVRLLEKRPDVLWRTTHASLVVAPWKAALPLVQNRVLEPLISFSLGQGAVRQAQPAADGFVLAAFVGALPPAYVVDAWQTATNEAAQLQTMGAAEWDPARTTVCDLAGGTSAVSRVIGQARIVQRRGWDFHLSTTIEFDVPQCGLLILDERYADNLVARVDGRVVPVQCANALWAAVQVTAGRHAVVLSRASAWLLPMLVSLATAVGVAIWAVFAVWSRRKP